VIDLKNLDDQAYRDGAILKGATAEQLDALAAAESSRKSLMSEVEELRGQSNSVSKEIGNASPEERPAKIEAANALKQDLKAKEAEYAELQASVSALALQIPNPAHESVPGGGEEDFELVSTVGEQTPAPSIATGAGSRANDDRRRVLPDR